MGTRRALTAAAAVVTLTACGGGQQTTPPVDLTGPLEALPPCGPAPAPADVEPPEGLVLPADAVVTGVTTRGPLSQVTGYVAMTPVQVRMYYEGRSDLEQLQIEDEVFEAEILVSDGSRRTFVKARAVCSQGSDVVAVVAAETDAAAVPAPAGSPATPP